MRKTTLVFLLLMFTLPHAGADDSDGDFDNDMIDDAVDSCFEQANPTQCDTDGDLIGNHCDADLNNDCIVNSFDLSIMRSVFGQAGPHAADLDCNGTVNSFDLSRMRAAFGKAPGPSALWNGCATSCADPVQKNVPMRWVEPARAGEPVTGSSQITTACDDGATMVVTTHALIPGDTYTMWFGFFDHPEECKFPPRTPANPDPKLRCGFFDLFNSAADPNMRYGGGLVATGTNDVFQTYVAAGAPPHGEFHCGFGVDGTLCSGNQIGWALKDDDVAVLTNPRGAEYQAVLKNHGPEDPAYTPEQTTTVEGGCRAAAPPERPFADPYHPCRDPQVAGAVSDIALECFDPLCGASWVASVGTPFVAGFGAGEDLVGGGTYALRIAGLNRDNVVEGSFDFTHTDIEGNVTTLSGELCYLTVSPSSRANILGTIAGSTAPAIAITVTDHDTNDVVRFNVPSITGVPLPLTCDVIVDPLNGGDVTTGNFFLADS